MSQAVAETGWRREVIASHLAGMLSKGIVLKFGDLLLYSPAMNALKSAHPANLGRISRKNPLVPGIGKEVLREQYTLSPEVLAAVLEGLTRDKRLEVVGDFVRLPGKSVVMKEEEAESKKKIEDAFSSAGLKVPALPEVLAGLRIDKVRAQKIITLLLRDKVLIKISDELVFHGNALAELRRMVVAQKARSPKMDVAKFKELTGISRKYAIPLLEYLDRERITKRVGDSREILTTESGESVAKRFRVSLLETRLPAPADR